MKLRAKPGFFLFISVAAFCHLRALSCERAYSLEKTATVLLLHMFHESHEEAPDLQLYTMVERIDNAFKEKDIKATIVSIASNKWEPNIKKRQASLVRQINTFIAHSRKLKITHIILAGHGNSDKTNLIIGDIALNRYNIRDFYEDFGLLRDFLAPKVKIFLFGCSTFKNSEEKELLVKAPIGSEKFLRRKRLRSLAMNTKYPQMYQLLFGLVI